MTNYESFNKLEQLDFKDTENLYIFNVSDLNGKQKRRIMEYIKYKGLYSFNCNCESFPIKEKMYLCKGCGSKYSNNDFEPDFGWFTDSYMGSYLKCWHDDEEDPSVYYMGDENDDDDLDFKIMNMYNSIIATPLYIPNHNGCGNKSEKTLHMAIDCIPIHIDVMKFIDIFSKISGSKKTYDNLEYIKEFV